MYQISNKIVKLFIIWHPLYMTESLRDYLACEFEQITYIEKQIFDQESVINTIVNKVNKMEDNLKK